jgi:hypothetical protein
MAENARSPRSAFPTIVEMLLEKLEKPIPEGVE